MESLCSATHFERNNQALCVDINNTKITGASRQNKPVGHGTDPGCRSHSFLLFLSAQTLGPHAAESTSSESYAVFLRPVFPHILQSSGPQSGPWTSSISIAWEPRRKENAQVPASQRWGRNSGGAQERVTSPAGVPVLKFENLCSKARCSLAIKKH